jgi:glycosyltransferase involved in cell wall biosynthesis
VPDLLAASDFFILPSLTEGLPLSVLEAMAQSLPVIVTPVGGVPEIVVHNEHGLLVPTNDAEQLSRAISRMILEPDLRSRMGAAAHRRVASDFSFEEMARRYESLYYRLCGARAA